MPGVVSLCFPAGHPWSGVWVRWGGANEHGKYAEPVSASGLQLHWAVKGLSVVWAGDSLCYPSLDYLHIIPL